MKSHTITIKIEKICFCEDISSLEDRLAHLIVDQMEEENLASEVYSESEEIEIEDS